MVPLLQGQAERIYGDDDAIGYELNGHRALFLGDHKIVYNRPPIGDGVWHLYNIATDPGETQDLRELQPQRFARGKHYMNNSSWNMACCPWQRISIRSK